MKIKLPFKGIYVRQEHSKKPLDQDQGQGRPRSTGILEELADLRGDAGQEAQANQNQNNEDENQQQVDQNEPFF